jgi:hypothetical protein
MFCPRCGQKQVYTEVSFCSRCGLKLKSVIELLSNYSIQEMQEQHPQKAESSLYKRRIRTGKKLLFFSFALLPVSIVFAGMSDHPVPLLIPFTLFLIGLFWLVYHRLFRTEIMEKGNQPQAIRNSETPPHLISHPEPYYNTFSKARVNTAEIVPPPSVTENTTRHLHERKDQRIDL